jgi:hypothetical protein
MRHFGLTAAWVRASLACLLVTSIAGCGSSSTAPSQNLNLTGTWSGVVGSGSGGGRALRVTWTASQSGSRVSGPATLLTSPAVTDLTFSGTMSGSLTGGQLSLMFAAPSGSVPGSATCSVTSTGSAAAGTSTISGTLDVTFVACEGLGLQPPTSDQLTLTRQ